MVTHEPDISRFAKRVIVFRDGTIRRDDAVLDRPDARNVLGSLPTLED
jgi:ABC-type lipoprotein export system ATPase subunit